MNILPRLHDWVYVIWFVLNAQIGWFLHSTLYRSECLQWELAVIISYIIILYIAIIEDWCICTFWSITRRSEYMYCRYALRLGKPIRWLDYIVQKRSILIAFFNCHRFSSWNLSLQKMLPKNTMKPSVRFLSLFSLSPCGEHILNIQVRQIKSTDTDCELKQFLF